MTKVAILGFGTVGSGVAEVLSKNSQGIARRSGGEIVVRELSAEQYVDILVSGGRPLINVDTLPAPAQELSGSECKILPLN